jgi:apolipoprotein N-acyltransferase
MGSFRIGYLSGLIHYITLIYWIVPCLQTYGMLPFYVSLIILFLFAAGLSLFLAGFTLVVNWICREAKMLFLTAPLLWVVFEFARAHLFTGFPWELLGYSQYRILPLIQIADIMGVYGLSCLVALGNCLIFLIYLSLSRQKWNQRNLSIKHALVCLVCFFIVLALVGGYGVWRMGGIEKAMAAAPPKRVSVIQGNIAQQMKWDPAFQIATIDRYIALSRKEAGANPHLIVWPETAMPFYFGHNVPLTKRVLNGIRSTDTDYIISSPGFIRMENRVAYRNRAFLLEAGHSNVSDTYDKAHLVPFGEYVPLKKWLPFLGKLVAQVGDFTAGEKGATLEWGNHRIGMLICYELIFPYLSRETTRNGANLLINITNDAWYGKTSAPYQHFSMAVFRAVENRRALARSANTGISGFIDPTGKIISASPIFKEAAITAQMPLMSISTVYTRFGDWFSLTCVIICLVAVIQRIFKKR